MDLAIANIQRKGIVVFSETPDLAENVLYSKESLASIRIVWFFQHRIAPMPRAINATKRIIIGPASPRAVITIPKIPPNITSKIPRPSSHTGRNISARILSSTRVCSAGDPAGFYGRPELQFHIPYPLRCQYSIRRYFHQAISTKASKNPHLRAIMYVNVNEFLYH